MQERDIVLHSSNSFLSYQRQTAMLQTKAVSRTPHCVIAAVDYARGKQKRDQSEPRAGAREQLAGEDVAQGGVRAPQRDRHGVERHIRYRGASSSSTGIRMGRLEAAVCMVATLTNYTPSPACRQLHHTTPHHTTKSAGFPLEQNPIPLSH